MQNLLTPGTSRDAVTANESHVAGYGAVFFNADDPGTEYWLWSDIVERIMPGAFDRAIREDDVIASFNHDPNFVIGRNRAGTLTLKVDAKGLRYDATLSDSPIAAHILAAVARGDVAGSSFMFQVGRQTWIEEKRADGSTLYIREINEVAPLYELGPVCFPAYAATTTEANSRSANAEGTPPRFAAWLANHTQTARRDLDRWQAERRDASHARRVRAARRLRLQS